MSQDEIFRTVSSIFTVRHDLSRPSVFDDDFECVGSLWGEFEVFGDGAFRSEPVPCFVGFAISAGGYETAGFYGEASAELPVKQRERAGAPELR